jgi:transposase InsO family protein
MGRTTYESFNAKLRYELLNGDIVYSLTEAKTVIVSWRRHYNNKRPHSLLGYRPLAPKVVQSPPARSGRPATSTVALGPVLH